MARSRDEPPGFQHPPVGRRAQDGMPVVQLFLRLTFERRADAGLPSGQGRPKHWHRRRHSRSRFLGRCNACWVRASRTDRLTTVPAGQQIPASMAMIAKQSQQYDCVARAGMACRLIFPAPDGDSPILEQG